jgi:hypothetical protein
MSLPALYTIFEEADKAPTKSEKIAVLHKYSNKNLKAFLGYVFDSNIKWLVPEGEPPYEPCKDDAVLLDGRIWQDFRLLQHFNSTGPYPHMKPAKRETMFISLLQTLHPKDAKLLLYVKDHRALPNKTITRALISEAFPLLVAKWGPEVEKPKKEKAVVTAPLESSSNLLGEDFEGFDDSVLGDSFKSDGDLALDAATLKSNQAIVETVFNAPVKKAGRPKGQKKTV